MTLDAQHVFTEGNIDIAYLWLCKQRAHFRPNADIWHLRFHWHSQRQALLDSLHTQDYTLLPQSVVTKADGSSIHLWSSGDALVLKMLAMALADTLVLSTSCTHVKGHGGLKATVNTLHSALPDYTYVMKTDVKGYYASIDHTLLLKQRDEDIGNPFIYRLLVQFVKRSVEKGGTFKAVQCGISRGCSLSPVIAAYYVNGLDKQMEADKRYFYRRYMDDIIVLAKTRWHLRCAIRTVNQHFNALKIEQAPDKTFIGRIEKQFDFLGYRFGLPHLAVAQKTISNAVNMAIRLYEKKQTAPKRAVALDDYFIRWLRWVVAGIDDNSIKPFYVVGILTNQLYPSTL